MYKCNPISTTSTTNIQVNHYTTKHIKLISDIDIHVDYISALAYVRKICKLRFLNRRKCLQGHARLAGFLSASFNMIIAVLYTGRPYTSTPGRPYTPTPGRPYTPPPGRPYTPPLTDLTLHPLVDLTLHPLAYLTPHPLADLTLHPLADFTPHTLADLTR